METVKKITKRTFYSLVSNMCNSFANGEDYALPEDLSVSYEDIANWADHEIELLDDKAVKAKARNAAKKASSDKLQDMVYDLLSSVDLKTIQEVVAEIGDEDVTPSMVANRLSKLTKAGLAEKEKVKVVSSNGGKTKEVNGYRKVLGAGPAF